MLDNKLNFTKKIIKKCHNCSLIVESEREQEKCTNCNKSFLPLNYFAKIHTDKSQKLVDLYADSNELHEEDLITGLYVLW
jgi:RNA polymerase subunit RPABC4/transcription elongation factor Spt4